MKRIALAFVLLSASAQAQPLSYFINSALKKNPSLNIQASKLQSAKAEKKIALGNYLPKVNLSYNKLWQSDVPTFTLPTPALPLSFALYKKNFYDFKINAVWPIFTGGRTTFNYFLKSRLEKAEALKLKLEKNRVVLTVKLDYYEALKAKRLLKSAKEVLKAAEKNLSDAEKLFKSGVVVKRDVLEAQVNLRKAQDRLSAAESYYETALQKLSSDSGVLNPSVDGDFPKPKALPLNLEKLQSLAQKHNPAILAAEEALNATKYGLKLSYSQFLPTAAVFAQYDRTNQFNGIGTFSDRIVGFEVDVPIFNGAKRFFEISKAKSKLNSTRYLVRKVENNVKVAVASSYYSLSSAYQRIEFAQSAVKEAKELLRESQLRYENQAGTSTEVSNALAYLASTQADLAQALADYYESLAKLEYAVGVNLKQSLK